MRNILIALALFSMIAPWKAGAQDLEGVSLVLEPHCVNEEQTLSDTALGPTPDILGEGKDEGSKCPSFEVENPKTLKTRPLKPGDILDMDIVIKNPSKEEIQRMRVWLNYDPTVLKGTNVEINDELFPTITPGEEDFDPSQGFVMIRGDADEESAPSDERILAARVEFEVISAPKSGTIIGFYDVQETGHTKVMQKSGSSPEGAYALQTDPGNLRVVFADTRECTSDTQCLEGKCMDGICSEYSGLVNGSDCQIDSQCESGSCEGGKCSDELETAPDSLPEEEQSAQEGMPNGSQCLFNADCASLNCVNNICIALIPPPSLEPSGTPLIPDTQTGIGQVSGISTAFSLLQVQNLRVTTKDNSAFLGWDPLKSSQLKAYNIYYGTTQGQYIQRKTIEGAMQSLTIRNLPEETKYYLAVRAVSLTDEESAFSQEVYVSIGDPSTSSALLAMPSNTASLTNPVRGGNTVPGETGIPSPLTFLVFASAIIGTAFAFRKQIALAAKRQ